MDSAKIKAILITTLVAIAALWLGLSAATAQVETGMWVSGISAVMICAILGKRVWMILPFATALNLTLMIPGQPNTILLAQALFVGFAGLLLLLRRLPYRLEITELEMWIIALCLCVGQAYLRNPVGLNIFGSGSVGGRPYAIFGAAIVSTMFLVGLRIPALDLKWIFRLHIIGGLLNFTMLAIGYFVPKIGIWFGSVNLDTANNSGYQEGTYGIDRATRIQFTRDIARNIALWISAVKAPIKACFHPIWAPLVLLSLAFAALSGYRSEIAAVGLTYLVGIMYRGGFTSVLLATAALIIGVSLLALVNIATPLPSNIQRSLTFLPGTWDQTHKEDAKNSTTWRTDMWKEALLTDYWISNKWLGDGPGITRRELNYIASLKQGQAGGKLSLKSNTLTLQQELMMSSNNYHSGPVSTIRAIGYIGLLVFLAAQIRLAMHAHRIIRNAKGTQWLPLVLLVGIPLIYGPFFFTFVFAHFGSSLTAYLTGVGMIRLLENNLTPSHPERQTTTLESSPSLINNN